MKPHSAVILVVSAGALIGLAVWSNNPEKPGANGQISEEPGPRFLPQLVEHAGDAASITIRRPGLTFTVQRAAGGVAEAEGGSAVWTIPDKANYPANADAVRGVLVGLAELREWEPKTDQPSLYSKLGVEDPAAPPADQSADTPLPQSTLVTLKDAKGETIAEVIVGNRKYGSTTATSGTYVRRSREAQSWLAKGTVEVPRDILGWLDAQFANIDRSRIRSVTITHHASPPIPPPPPLVVSRDTGSATFAAQGIPAGRELKEPGIADTIASCITLNSFQDVAKVESVDFTGGPDGKPGPTAEIRCFDGLVVTINAVPKEGRQWWKLAASADLSIVEANAGGDAEKIKTETEKLNKEVKDLDSKWSPFAFAPNDYKAKSINNTLDDMLKPAAAPPTPATQPSPAGVPAAPGAKPGPEASAPATPPAQTGEIPPPVFPPDEPEPKPDE